MAKDLRYEQHARPGGARKGMSVLWGVAALLAIAVIARRLSQPPPPPRGSLEATVESQARAFLALEARESEIGRTAWSTAHQAFQHEDVFLSVWSALSESVVPLGLLADFDAGEITTWTPALASPLPHGIQWVQQRSPRQTWTRTDWNAHLAQWRTEGWNIARLSIRQTRFRPAGTNGVARSLFALQAQLTNGASHTVATLRGDLAVEWQPQPQPGAAPAPARIDATQLECYIQSRPAPAFREWFARELRSQPALTLDPVLSADLDGDGLPELILVGAGQILRRAGASFEASDLPALPPSMTYAAALADLDGDGRLDLLVAGDNGLVVLPGQAGATSFGPPRTLWQGVDPLDPDTKRPLKHAQVLTLADIDGDGDLDVFLGQYKLPYQKGQFPTPYYDANDGFPSHLLRNDGAAGFQDITNGSGLETRSRRRVYSASLVDLDGDGDSDLVMVSDFAGVDVFLNDGRGHFTDVTPSLGEARQLFGMAHALGDFDGDGRLDLFAIGMNSPTASVLESVGARRPGIDTLANHRLAMTVGNRLLLGDGRGGFKPAEGNPALATAGWAWGVTAFDANNDGRLDFYLANGHETFASPVDYERQFWLHDIYVGSSSNDPVADVYFRSALGRRKAGKQSYGGWQDNVFFLNVGTGQYLDAAFLMGVARPEDCRNVLSEDLDGDGRLDLLVTSYEQWPTSRQRLFIYRNELAEAGHWIGFQLPARGLNARVEIRTARGVQTRWLVSGDSYRSQHSFNAHFGLGPETQLASATVVWANGTRTDLGRPTPDRWHRVP